MTRVLLLTDTERVLKVFESLQAQGVMQLHAAATLNQADLEISASVPDITFVQSRISGFSGEIMLRHLKKTLPKGARIVLLAGDAGDAAQAKQLAYPFVDLSVADEELAEGVRLALSGAPRPRLKREAKGEAPPAAKSSAATAAETSQAGEGAARRKEPAGATGGEGTAAQEAEKEPVKSPPEEGKQQVTERAVFSDLVPREAEQPAARKPPEEQKSPAEEPPQSPGGESGGSFEDLMRQAAAKGVNPLPGPLAVEDRVDLTGKPQVNPAGAATFPEPEEHPSLLDQTRQGEPLADALLRAEQKRGPGWLVPLVLALLLTPVIGYFVIKSAKPRPIVTESKGPAPAPGGVPEGKEPGVTPVPAPSGQPAAKGGLRTLPPILEGLKIDDLYGKEHPGWVRYIGARAEYKLFKEGDLYRAVQVVALGGGSLSDTLFTRVLTEFAGAAGYQVQSSGKKGNYLLEQGVAQNGVALTVYRNLKDRRIKAVVLYYR